MAAFVYLETRARNGIVATNIQNDGGNFALALDEKGFLRATIRNSDGRQFCLYEDGHLVASSPCLPLADSKADVLWFGTDADGLNLWNGRIDEVALFDRVLSEAEVAELYQAALEERGIEPLHSPVQHLPEHSQSY